MADTGRTISAAADQPLPLSQELGARASGFRRRRAFEPALRAAECSVSVVFPCRDEADAVASCVRRALAELEEAGIDGEVVVCDNASTDSSGSLAREAGA